MRASRSNEELIRDYNNPFLSINRQARIIVASFKIMP